MEDEGLSSDHLGDQKISFDSLSSMGPKPSGIQKIIPSTVDVSTFNLLGAFLFFFNIFALVI